MFRILCCVLGHLCKKIHKTLAISILVNYYISNLLYIRMVGVGGVILNNSIEIEAAAALLKLLGDKTRLSMVKMLDTNDYCVCEFVEIFKMSQPAISQHIRKLKDAGLVQETRRGQWIIYSLNKENVYYPFVHSLLLHLPSQDFKLKELEEQGLRISCD